MGQVHKLGAVVRAGVGALVLALLGLVGGTARAETPRELVFNVERDGRPFGTHRIGFSSTPAGLTVAVAIELKVDFGPITVFRYRHQNQELWEAGPKGLRLARIDTKTDDDGTGFQIAGQAEGRDFRLKTGAAAGLLPGDIIPTSYWHRASLDRQEWLDTQSGQRRRVSVQPLGTETIEVAGAAVDAHRYRVRGDLEMDLWYLPNGEWAGLTFSARGSEIRYRRITPATVALLADSSRPAPAGAASAP